MEHFSLKAVLHPSNQERFYKKLLETKNTIGSRLDDSVLHILGQAEHDWIVEIGAEYGEIEIKVDPESLLSD